MTDNTLPKVYLDEDIADADWIKHGRWDLPVALGPFMTAIGASNADTTFAQQRAAVKRFMTLPAAGSMPAGLRSSLTRAGLLE